MIFFFFGGLWSDISYQSGALNEALCSGGIERERERKREGDRERDRLLRCYEIKMKKPPVGPKLQSGRGVIPPVSESNTSSLLADDFRTSKKDKRTIKHSSFVSKIEKNSQKTPKRRRASKKLAANLDSLADALPEAEVQSSEHHQPNSLNSQVNVIKQKTLKQKPGALKRRQNLEKVERDRFARNMAQMSAMDTTAAAPHAEGDNHHHHQNNNATEETNGTSNRWAALRSFISQTMEQQPVFKGSH